MHELRILLLLLMPLSATAQQAEPMPEPPPQDLVWQHVQTLETMISMWPEQEYYLQLASLYGRVGDFDRQLELYEIAHAMGWLTETMQFVQLARLLLRAERIDEVDEVLQKALEAELTEATLDDD